MILVWSLRVNFGTAVIAFSTDSASNMLLCPRKWLVKILAVQITVTSWRTPWSHCYKNTSPMTFTMLMKPAFSTRWWPIDLMPLEMKLCESQNTSTLKMDWVCCYSWTWLAQTNFHPYWLARLQDSMPWVGKELAWACLKLTTTTTAMGGWLQLSLNIGWTNGMRDWLLHVYKSN